MKIGFSKAFWGMNEGQTLEDKFRLTKEAGFDGVEISLGVAEAAVVRELCQQYGLYYIAQIFPLAAKDLPAMLDEATAAGAIKIVAQSGRDKWPQEEAFRFWEEALTIQDDYDVPVAHETHRHRVFYSPWSTAACLEKFPALRLTLDLSHWCCVCESMLDDMKHYVDLAISRAIHIHARVGHWEGPQVNDPAAPENAEIVAKHVGWWDAVRAAREKDGTEMLTVTPEFGPPGYMPTLPFTRMPVADHWGVNLWMRDHLKKHWGLAV